MTPFKICPLCSDRWPNRSRFLEDPELELIGYQVDFEDLESGLFLFNHRCCGTTLAIRSAAFRDLYAGPFFKNRRTGTDACPGYCLRCSEFSPCLAEFECSWVREVLQLIRRWPKLLAGQRRCAGSGR